MAVNQDNQLQDQIPHEQLHSLDVLRSPRAGKVIVRVLLIVVLIFIIVLFLPWQQNITGYGKVAVLSPSKRPQQVMNTIPGRVSKWFVQEGDSVAAGDTIAVLEEVKDKFFDPELIQRLEEQLAAKERSQESKEDKIQAYGRQLNALFRNRELKLQQVKNKLRQAQLKVFTDSIELENQKVQLEIATRQVERQRELYQQGLVSLFNLEKREQTFQKTVAKIVETENKLLISQNERVNAEVEINATQADYAEKISKTQSDINAAEAELAETAAEVAKLRNELANMRIRNEQYVVRAPQTGYVQLARSSGIGEILKEGGILATIMPTNPDVAVEIFVSGMDRRWIDEGRTVRIEFDGFPAIQLSGNEDIRLGTFGGTVANIDRVSTNGGKFRLQVVPTERWPENLAQGVGAFAWIMLDTVPIWFEIWRRLNGFPPNVVEDAAKSNSMRQSEEPKK